MGWPRAQLRSASIALACALVVGCGGMTSTPLLVIGPYDHAPLDLFPRVLHASDTLGYPPYRPDASQGTFVVAARSGAFTGAPAVFGVRCYQGGWIQIGVLGRGVRVDPGSDRFVVTPQLRLEMEDYVIGLRAGLHEGPS